MQLFTFKKFHGAADWHFDIIIDFMRNGRLLSNPFWVRPFTQSHNTLTIFGVLFWKWSLRLVLSCTSAYVKLPITTVEICDDEEEMEHRATVHGNHGRYDVS